MAGFKLSNFKLKPKLIAAFLICGIIPLVAVAYLAMQKAQDGMMKQAFNQLEAVQNIKKGQVEKYFGERQGDMGVLVETIGTLRKESIDKLTAIQTIKKNQIETFFGERLGDAAVLADNPYTKMAILELDKTSKAAKQRGYSGLRLLQDPTFKGVYDSYNPTFEYYMQTYGYYDIFLICPKEGDVFYTAAREADFGIELSRENTALAEVWKKALSTGSSALSDMEAYAPSNGAPAMFVACPVVDGGKTIGVVGLQISNEAINTIMMERTGMGETGECYLVGSDLKMRSSSYLDPINHSVEASLKGTVELNGVDTEAANDALAGKTDARVIIDYNGNPVLSAYAPLKLGDITWAILAEIDVAEAFCPKDEHGNYFFAKYQEMYGYYDLFLINPDGFCFYTVAQEADYHSNFLTGEFRNSNMGKLVRDVISSKDFGFADFRPYVPSNDEPCAFIAQPFVANGNVEIIIGLQLPLDAINGIMQERAGMGETGETYLVGFDKRMRSDSYLDPTGHSVNASFAGTVENNGVDTKATRDAIAGKSSREIIVDYNGNPVLSAYSPMDVLGENWVVICEIDEAEIVAPITAIRNSIMVIGVVIAAFIALFGFFMAMSIVKPVNKVVEMIKDVAQGEGDLTKRLEADSKDEIGELAKWFNVFMDKLHDIIAQVAGNTDQLAGSANEISSSSEELSTGVKEQTAQTAQVSTAIEEMTATIMESSKNIGEANEKAKNAGDKSQEGSRMADEASRGMDEIVESSNVTSKNIEGLSEKATAIGEIISVIDDIADQTNLLALNAAIEAARAGEQGRGFAVVADEVRKLAERTTKATKEVADNIKGIQADVTTAAAQVNDSNDIVSKGKEVVQKTNDSLNEIYTAIESVQGMMNQVATASEEQSTAAEQISKNVENVDRITKETATGAEQSATAAEQLNRQAEELRNLVGGFKLRKDAVTNVKAGV